MINGRGEIMNSLVFKIALFFCVIFPKAYLAAQSVADPNFRVVNEKPRYETGKGPLVLYDEGHNNPFSLKGQYAAFGKVLEADGYRFKTLVGEVTAKSLSEVKVFATVNAMYDMEQWNLPTKNAFTDQEVDEIYNWVFRNGGSLFLITDQMPAAGSVSNLAARFGFNLINGIAMRKDGKPELFSQSEGNLTSTIITDAKIVAVNQYMGWFGTGFFPPQKATVVSWLGADYEVLLPSESNLIGESVRASTPKIDGLGLANASLIQCGKGKVFLIADAAPFYAMLKGLKSNKQGMNHPDASQNAQFLLNIMNWLSR